MSVLIKGMEIPANCQNCFASDDESRFCRAAKKYIPMLGKPKFCPLIELPDHGDLIDRDALKEPVGSYTPIKWSYEYGASIRLEDIDHAPVVIPAERSEK